MTDNGESPVRQAVAGLLHELCSAANAGNSLLGESLDGAVEAAREAVRTWTSRVEALAAQNRARDDAMVLERRARDQVCTILDLVMQLATLPDQSAADGTGRGPFGEAAVDGSERPDPDTSTASMPTAGLAVRLLGPFELHVAGWRVTAWRGRRGPAVLQFLISRRGRAVKREALTEALWPDVSPDLGRHRVHQAVYALRQTLQQLDPDHEYILCSHGAYRLNPELSVWTDVAEFERLVALAAGHDSADREGDALAAYGSADTLYRGDYLEGGSCAEWAVAERRRLRADYVIAGTRLSQLHAEMGEHRAALAVCAKVLERDPWNEEVTRRAMRSYVAIGNPSLGLQLYKVLEEELLKELGVAPSAETRRLFAQLCSTASDTP
jgi:DNA-binding SARP family transcriptional activator